MFVSGYSFAESNSDCGSGTIFDPITNSCVLDGEIPLENEELVEKIFEFDIRKDRYVQKEPIFISGYVQYISPTPYINIKIFDGNNQLVENIYLFPNKDNYFFYHTKSVPSWGIDMTYTVKVTYDGQSGEKYFKLVSHSKDYDPQSVESLQKKLAQSYTKNNNLLIEINKLKEEIELKQAEMDSMSCYKTYSP